MKVEESPHETNVGHAGLPNAWDLFSPSWQAFKTNWLVLIFGVLIPILGFLFLVVILQILAHFVFSSVSSTTTYGYSAPNHAVDIINIISVIVGAGTIIFAIPLANALYYYAKLESAKGNKLAYWASVKTSMHFFWRILGLSLLRMLIILVGLVLVIIPGLFMWRRYFLAPYYLVDKDLSIGEAMRQSAADSKTYSDSIWGMGVVFVLISVIGIIPLVGWIISAVAGIVYMCAGAVRYYQITAAK